jgi:DNA-binding NtrC family response regulator
MQLQQINSKLIKKMIKEQNLKRYWVAHVAGIHRTTLRRWLKRRSTLAHPNNIEKLSQALSVPCRHLIRDAT